MYDDKNCVVNYLIVGRMFETRFESKSVNKILPDSPSLKRALLKVCLE